MHHLRSPYYHALVSFIAVLLIGCSGSGSPTNPEITPERLPSHASGNQLWGFWTVNIDPVSLTAEFSPIRGAAFTANVTQFMQPPSSPVHMLSISIDSGASDIPNKLIAVDVTLKHPFPGINTYRGFDVRGIFMSDGSQTAGFDSSVTYPDWFSAAPGVPAADSVLLNADGYTRFWNPDEFSSWDTIFGYTKGSLATPLFIADATINPFKYFADELDEEDPFDLDPANRGTFSTVPGVNTRRYLIQFDGLPLEFNYAVCASWNEPDKDFAPDFPLEAFDTNANCQEAYKITLADAGSDAWYVDSENYGGQFILDIEIFDWQAGSTSEVPAEINRIWLDSPAFDDGIGNNFIDILAGSYEILPGTNETSAIFRATLPPNFEAGGIESDGDFPVFIGVESANPDTYQPQIDGGDLFDYPDETLTAFNVGTVNVLDYDPNPPQPDVILVFETAQEFPADAAGYDAFSPCVIEEIDGDLCFAYAEWLDGSSDSYQAVYRSHNDGTTWPDWRWNQHSMGGGVHFSDTVKLWASSHNLSYQICNRANIDETVYGAGFASGTFPDGINGSEKAVYFNYNIDNASEVLQDAETYVYLLGDYGGQITFKRSTYPQCLNCDTWGWSGFPTYPIVNPGRLSRVRSSSLYNGTMYFVYFEPDGSVIRLAHNTTDGFTWDTSTIVWDASSSDWEKPHDPGLYVDDTGFHVSFLRTETSSGDSELCYAYSSDGSTWTDPVTIYSSSTELVDTPIFRYDFDTTSVLATVWWEGDHIYTSYSLDEGETWADPVMVSANGTQNKQCDLIVSSTGNWHFVFSNYDSGTSYWEIHHRRAHLEWQ